MKEEIFKITKLETQKKNKNRISVYINDQYSFSLSEDLVFKFSLEEGKEIDMDFINKVIRAEEQKKANNYALRLLSYRPRSRKEIIEKMKRKGYDYEIINQTISYLEEYNYINDWEFAKQFIKSKLSKFGRNRIVMELSTKGIEEGIINKLIDQEMDEEIEYNRALECAQKKMKLYKEDNREKTYRKLGSYLQRKGYSYHIISRVLREVLFPGKN